jgi:hypothetical protein
MYVYVAAASTMTSTASRQQLKICDNHAVESPSKQKGHVPQQPLQQHAKGAHLAAAGGAPALQQPWLLAG